MFLTKDVAKLKNKINMETSQLTTNLLIQYILVGAILLAISVWIVWKLIKLKKQGPKSCCGCSLSESCGKKLIKNKSKLKK